MKTPRVSIIILNWNGWRDTIECLESLYRIEYPNYDVIVIDNDSKDESIQKIKEYASGKIKVESKFFRYNPKNKPIKVFEIDEEEARQGKFNRPFYEKFDPDRRLVLIKNKENYGYAGGNNIGIKFALSIFNPDYVLILNNDTVVEPKFLSELVKVAEMDKKIGIVGSLIRLYYTPNVIQSNGIQINLKVGRIRHIQEINPQESVDCVMGCSMLISKKLLSNGELFDNAFFVYVEEIDFCLRAKKNRGYIIKSIPYSLVFHKHRGSTGYIMNKFILYYRARNYILMTYKLFKDVWILLVVPYLFTIIIESLIWAIKLKNMSLLISTIRGIYDGLKRLCCINYH